MMKVWHLVCDCIAFTHRQNDIVECVFVFRLLACHFFLTSFFIRVAVCARFFFLRCINPLICWIYAQAGASIYHSFELDAISIGSPMCLNHCVIWLVLLCLCFPIAYLAMLELHLRAPAAKITHFFCSFHTVNIQMLCAYECGVDL